MLKDIVVNLSSRGDFAAQYATSIAAMFSAHVTGVSFVYEPVIPDGMLGGVPVDLIELQRQESSKAANDAVSRFDAGVKKGAFPQIHACSTRPSAGPPRASPRLRGASTSPWSGRPSAKADQPMIS